MGTPCTCAYASLFFGWFERQFLLRKYWKNILFYKRAIDDVIIVWILDKENPTAYEQFKDDLNNQCALTWTSTLLSTSVDFLDLTVTIAPNGYITTKTFQKKMNLFLYIPSNSAHPPGLLKNLVFGLLSTYFNQNKNTKDFLEMTRLLLRRLLNRGHKYETLEPVFQSAVKNIELKANSHFKPTPPPLLQSKPLFLHLPYHPKDISRKRLRDIYDATCQSSLSCIHNDETDGDLKIDRLTIAYSRPKNLRDLLFPTKLVETEDINVAKFAKRDCSYSQLTGPT